MLDIFNRKVKIVNEELRKQIEVLEEENAGLKFYKIKTNNEIRNLENEIKIKEGALGISIKAGVEKDKEIAKLKNWIKEIRKKENEDRRKLLHDVVAMDRENKQLREEIEELKSARFERTKATYDAIRDEYKDKVNTNKITVAQQQRVFGITPQNIETFRMLRGMALNGRNKRIRNKYINKMAESMEAIFKVITEQGDEITE